MKLILDTNVIVAAIRSRRGASAKLLSLVGTGRFDLILSVPLALEYESVLKREELRTIITADDATDLVSYLCANAIRQDVVRRRPLLSDAGDDFVAELALASSSDYLVTHNVRDFAPLASHGISVVSPGEMIQVLGE